MASEQQHSRRRAHRHGERWNQILDAATLSFREHGYEAASLQDIASRVGILKGSLYNYITSKEDLFFAVVERPATEFMDRLAILQEDEGLSVLDKLRQIIDQQLQIFAQAYPAPFVYLGRVQSRSEPQFEEWDAYYLRSLHEILRQGVKGGELRPDLDVRLAAYALLGMMAWMHAWYEPRGEDSDRRIAHEFWKLYVGGIAADPIER